MSTFSRIIRRYGFANGLSNYLKVQSGASPVALNGIKHPIHIRKRTSDRALFKQIFYTGEYDISFSFRPQYIIDGGANAGYFSILFANRFPEATILAIEPDSSNYECLQKNTAHYPHIQTLKTAIWSKKAYLQLTNENFDKCAVKSQEVPNKADAHLQADSIDDLIAIAGFPHIDILKLDVEGAEKEIFSSNFEKWLPTTRLIVVELHDHIKKGTSTALLKAAGRYDFSFFTVGENFCLLNNHFRD